MDYQEQIEEVVSTAKFGDLIEFSYPIGYSHWGVYDADGHVVHFALADEGALMGNIRKYLQTFFPVCGDILLGVTKIRRVPLGEVNVPQGAHILISNGRHAYKASAPEDMRLRLDALLDRSFTYKLFNFNCEHFATFVRFGKAVCNQIPFRQKNVECKEATDFFSEQVCSQQPVEEDQDALEQQKKDLEHKESSDFFSEQAQLSVQEDQVPPEPWEF